MIDTLWRLGQFVETRKAALTRDEFSRVVTRHQGAVFAVAMSALRDRAASEEVTQEAFLVAWRRLPELGEPPELPGWICGIARNLARNARRQAWRSVGSDALDSAPARAASPLDEVVDKESEALVWRALEALPETYREPLVLFYGCDQSIREVASALGISEGNAKQRLSRGRLQLEKRVQSLVERTLKRSAPGAALTAAILAAVALEPGTAHASPAPRAPSASPRLAVGKLALAGAGAVALLALGVAMLGGPGANAVRGAAVPSETATAIAPVVQAAPAARTSTATRRWLRPRALSAPGPAGVASPRRTIDGEAVSDALRARLDRKVDLELNEAAVGDVLRLLGELAGTEIVVRGEIAPDVTFRLHATTVMEALDETLEQAGAEWRETDVIRVVGGEGPRGPRLDAPPISLEVRDVPFAQVAEAFSGVLDTPIVVADGLSPPLVTARFADVAGGTAWADVVGRAALRYEVVDGIEVRPEEGDVEE